MKTGHDLISIWINMALPVDNQHTEKFHIVFDKEIYPQNCEIGKLMKWFLKMIITIFIRNQLMWGYTAVLNTILFLNFLFW